MPLPPAILFDWDNTLIDTFPTLFAAHNAVRKTLNEPLWDEAQARANIRLAAKDAFPLWYGDRAGAALAAYDAYIRTHHLKRLEKLPGADDLICFLAGQGVPLGIVSNKRGGFLRDEVSHCGWAGRFGAVIGADDVAGPGKPSPEGIAQALEKMNIHTSLWGHCWYAGDTENDIKTAKAAGIIPVFIENKTMSNPAEIKALGAEITFPDVMECLAYLQSLG